MLIIVDTADVYLTLVNTENGITAKNLRVIHHRYSFIFILVIRLYLFKINKSDKRVLIYSAVAYASCYFVTI